MSVFFLVDDKHVPLFRVMWVAATPHFCGEDDCQREGYYEVRLEQGEVVWAKHEERDALLTALEAWAGGMGPPGEDEENWE
jgi:hypothetical protein